MTRAVLLVLVLALLVPAAADAAACAPRTTVADLEDEVMCSVCGIPLGLAGEAPQAVRERAFIARLIRACRSKDQIKAALVAEFGPAVLAEPPDRGFAASATVVPVGGALVVLAALLLTLLRRRRRRASRPPSAPPSLSRADARRLERELDRLR